MYMYTYFPDGFLSSSTVEGPIASLAEANVLFALVVATLAEVVVVGALVKVVVVVCGDGCLGHW